ncbi:hypothetical protein V490_08476 [Pseudogymnoascus sp. VKM F-3557]|nr:hypothetical protein V490_08476 [Pseudogymnoascus sp. VKM F-3557]
MADGQEYEADSQQEDNTNNNNQTAYKSDDESDDNDAGNAATSSKANNQGQQSKSLYKARPQRQTQQQPAPNGNMQMQSRDEAREKAGYRAAAIRESRIKDRPIGKKATDSALKIKIELDLEVEVDLYARVKGDHAPMYESIPSGTSGTYKEGLAEQMEDIAERQDILNSSAPEVVMFSEEDHSLQGAVF